jgi:hypothetical protein
MSRLVRGTGRHGTFLDGSAAGEVYGGFLVLDGPFRRQCGGRTRARVSVRCRCGSESEVDFVSLRRKMPSGCRKCTRRRATDPNRGAVRKTWEGMIRRCERPTHRSFYAHVGPKPSASHSIDRVDTNGNYEPGNVRWATRSEQSKNRRPWNRRRAPKPPRKPGAMWQARYVEAAGIRLSIKGWARRLGVARHTIQSRIRRGWPPHLAVTTPPKHRSQWSNTKGARSFTTE